jgi:predicted membrane protein
LKVTDLKVSNGVGQTEVWLPARGQVSAKISGGIGQLTITVPEGMAARIHASTGLGSLSISSRFARQDDVYISGNYSTAEDRIDLDISGGVGEIIIR